MIINLNGYLNKLVDEYNNIYHRSVGEKVAHADYSALTEKYESNLFSRKLRKGSHQNLFTNNADVSQTNSHKYLGVVLPSKLTFHDHLDIVFTKVRKTIDLLCKLNSILLRAALVTTPP